jgi:hypothetical protein
MKSDVGDLGQLLQERGAREKAKERPREVFDPVTF